MWRHRRGKILMAWTSADIYSTFSIDYLLSLCSITCFSHHTVAVFVPLDSRLSYAASTELYVGQWAAQHMFCNFAKSHVTTVFGSVLRSRSRKEPHKFRRAVAVSRRGPSSGSDSHCQHLHFRFKNISKNKYFYVF
jgi:hypothetical protein